MADNLQESGVRLVAADFDTFKRVLGQANKVLDKHEKSSENVAKQSVVTGKSFSKLGVAAGVMVTALVAVVAAIGAVVAGFVALGVRGANLPGLARSFDLLTARVGVLSTTLLTDLREAAGGTVADFELIKNANLALAGASGEFGRAFGENLPKILEIARVQARATGQDVDFLFTSLVSGIKRASPLLIDNTGIVLKIGEANKALADELGTTVAALTSEEKQIAILNAVLESGQQALDTFADVQETAAEKISRAGATITNVFDTLGVAIQPAFAAILDVLNQVLGAIGSFVSQAAPFIGAIATIVGELIQGINLGLGGGGDLAQNLFTGAARAFGAFAEGILQAANQLIFPAIIGIAKFIQDFLIGLSPPKKGPLSDIDKGGANTMEAWLEGFTGVSLQPVEDVARAVSEAFGDIGTQSLKVVENRLNQLDRAIFPFRAQLEIVKSQFEAINETGKSAVEAINRQIDRALEALGRGDQQAADIIRGLEARKGAIQGVLNSQQALTDQAQIQLALAAAQQVRERTLLNLRKQQLGLFANATKARRQETKDTATSAAKTKAARGGAAAETPAAAGALDSIALGETPDVLSAFGLGQDQIADARLQLDLAFKEGLDPATLATFNRNRRELEGITGRIGAVDIGSRLRDRFGGLVDIFDPEVEGSPANLIKKAVESLFGTGPDSISNFISNIDLTSAISSLQTEMGKLGATLGLDDPSRPLGKAKADIESFFSDGVNSISDFISRIDLTASIASFETEMDKLGITLGLDDPERPLGRVKADIESFFGSGPNSLGSIIGDIDFESAIDSVAIELGKIGTVLGFDDPNSLLGKAKSGIAELFGDGPFSISNIIANIDFEAAIDAVVIGLGNLLAIFNFTDPESPLSKILGFVGQFVSGDLSIPELLNGIVSSIDFDQIRADLLAFFALIFNPEREGSPANIAVNFVKGIVDPETEGSIPWHFNNLRMNVETGISDFASVIDENIIQPVKNFLTGDEEGTLQDILNKGIQFFAAFPERVLNALRGFGLLVFIAVVKPIETVINSLITLLEDAVKGIFDEIGRILSPLQGGVFDTFGTISDALGSLEAAKSGINFGRVNIAAPDFLLQPTTDQGGHTTNNTTQNFNFSGVADTGVAAGQFARADAGIP